MCTATPARLIGILEVATEVFSIGSLTTWWTLIGLGTADFAAAPVLVPSSVWLALGLTPVAMLVGMVRRLQRSGYDHGDLLRAMHDDLEERCGDLVSTYGSEGSRLDRWLKRLFVGGLGVHAAGLGWMMFGPYIPGAGEVLGAVLGLSLPTWIGAGSASAVRHQLRGHLPGQGWLKFWDSSFGRALFRFSRFRLEQRPAGAPYGPTELAIGIAVDRLFEALPTSQRQAFRELPDVVHRLEADAERMRAHRKELDALIGEAEDVTCTGAAATGDANNVHDALVTESKNTRAAAEDRLREVMAALETIRVELLRLHAGSVSTESVTMDLSAAKELSNDVARMLEGRREVERLLGRRAAPELTTMPTPA